MNELRPRSPRARTTVIADVVASTRPKSCLGQVFLELALDVASCLIGAEAPPPR